MSAAKDWVYQPPNRDYPEQCWYRASPSLSMVVPNATADSPEMKLIRFAESTSAEVIFVDRRSSMRMELDVASLRALFNALGDALADISVVEAEQERVESFRLIQEEMRDADENGASCCLYAHPDVHYVPAGQVAAKVAELEAAGATRYLVLPDPAPAAASTEVSA